MKLDLGHFRVFGQPFRHFRVKLAISKKDSAETQTDQQGLARLQRSRVIGFIFLYALHYWWHYTSGVPAMHLSSMLQRFLTNLHIFLQLPPISPFIKASEDVTDGYLQHITNKKISLDVIFSYALRTSQWLISIPPTIVFGRSLPETSAIFSVVSSGDLIQLRMLLSRRMAFLSDRDIKGRCLLNVSVNRD